MDREQEELQFLKFSGIYAESFKIISTWRKLFTQITLTLILPLSFIFLVHSEISQLLFFSIQNYDLELSMIQEGSPLYLRISHLLKSEWIELCLFKVAYFTITLIFSLLSTSAVVYAIASIYTAKDVTFTKIMTVIPKVWKRLIVTFLWSFSICFAYNLPFALFFLLWIDRIGPLYYQIAITVAIIVFYIVGLVYITMIWQLASVVSVLEDVYGRKAMMKSKALIKGKIGVHVACFLGLVVCFMVVMLMFELFVISYLLQPLGRVLMGFVCLLLLVVVFLVGLVVQTVIYFVCKSYHRENIDKSVLADHLDVYLGDYVPLKAKDIQLEQLHA